jgi:methionyl aminopeptidase
MANPVKSEEEIALLRENHLLVSKTLAQVGRHIGVGVSGLELDKVAREFICDSGATPAFLGYNGFPASICVSVNDVVIHGVPTAVPFKDGDIVSIDCGTYYKGYYGDSAYTFGVGNINDAAKRLIATTKECLRLGAEQAVAGRRIGDISNAVQSYAQSHGYGVVRCMVGHGIGRNLHERPDVPNYGKAGSGKKLLRGMVLCIEPMITMGGYDLYVNRHDNWSMHTLDGSMSAHFEWAVAVGAQKSEPLTNYDEIEEVLMGRQ